MTSAEILVRNMSFYWIRIECVIAKQISTKFQSFVWIFPIFLCLSWFSAYNFGHLCASIQHKLSVSFSQFFFLFYSSFLLIFCYFFATIQHKLSVSYFLNTYVQQYSTKFHSLFLNISYFNFALSWLSARNFCHCPRDTQKHGKLERVNNFWL